MKLDLGSGNPEEGEIQPEGYILQDIQPHPGIDIVCDIVNLQSFVKPGECQKIRASHVLEHFPTNQVFELLKMFRLLLEKDGELEIHVPNLRWHAALFLEDRDEEAITYMFGGQKDEYDFHKTGFTPHVLIRKLNASGFKVTECVVENSIHIKAVKE